jgi:hypothetical protein
MVELMVLSIILQLITIGLPNIMGYVKLLCILTGTQLVVENSNFELDIMVDYNKTYGVIILLK